METESTHGFQKYTPQYSRDLLESGVANAGYSYADRCIDYTIRAGLFESVAQSSRRGGLQLVQSLGKAAHTMVVLRAAAEAQYANEHVVVASLVETIESVAERLGNAPMSLPANLPALAQRQRQVFDCLQSVQSGLTPEALSWGPGVKERHFLSLVTEEVYATSIGFVAAAEEYGWPVPGRTSGDTDEWQL